MGTRSHPDREVEGNKYTDELTECDDAETVVKAMLTENTGRHLLDSGSAYGRHWEENREGTAPWEKPRMDVQSEYVVKNVYHHLSDTLQRDATCTRLERALYAYGEREEREAWLTCMEDVADSYHDGREEPFTVNTYNSEYGSLSQCIQFTGFEWGGDSYVFVQVHGGCDIRGGYTKPRVFATSWHELMPHEFSFYCNECDWSEAESVIEYDTLREITDPDANECECSECGHKPVHVG